MTPYIVIAVALVVACAVSVASFLHPHRVLRRSAIAAVCALVAPFIIAYVAAPFLGEGAGMGVAFILYALTASILLLALAAALGAAARHAWAALNRANG